MKQKRAIVIGSGIAGIAASIRLARAGFCVTVLEKNEFTGGKLSELRSGGYRFDAGPSLFTLPSLVDELFTLCGENPRDHFHYTRLETICRYFYPDGTILDSFADNRRFADELEAKTGEPASNTLKYLKACARKWELTSDVFIFSDFSDYKTFLSRSFLKGLANVGELHVLETMHAYHRRTFKTPYAVQLFDRYATYNGSDPYRVPATLSVIPHVEHGMGAFIPDRGMYAIVESLTALARRHGVVFKTGERVTSIAHKGNCVRGVETEINWYDADIVVANADAVSVYRYLLEDSTEEKKWAAQERSTSALVFNWGMKAEFPELDMHNIFFSENYPAEFQALFGSKTVYDDPTVYVFVSSKHVRSDAPPGCENWFTMINVPENVGQDWDMLVNRARELILNKLSRRLGKNLADLIETELVEDPRWIEQRTSSVNGSLYGPSGNSRWAAFMRHANRSSRYRGLYFCGGSVHPGGGIPMCLSSAKITANLIQKHESR